MSKISISVRLDSELLKWIDSKKTNLKNRSDVISELLMLQKVVNAGSDSGQAISSQDLALLRMGSKSSMLAVQLLSQFVKTSNPEKSKDINDKALSLFKESLDAII